MGAVIGDADHRTVGHRLAGEITHTLVGAFAEEIASLEVGKSHADRSGGSDGRHGADRIVDIFGYVDCDVASVTFGPSLFPEIAGYFSYFFNLGCEHGAVF